jgi:hypothetical protein
MVTVTFPEELAVAVPEAGDAESHFPPEIVDEETVKFNEPDPAFKTLIDCDGGAPPVCTVWKKSPDCEILSSGSPPPTVAMIEIAGIACVDGEAETDADPKKVPMLRLVAFAVTETELDENGATVPLAGVTDNQSPPDSVEAETLKVWAVLPLLVITMD